MNRDSRPRARFAPSSSHLYFQFITKRIPLVVLAILLPAVLSVRSAGDRQLEGPAGALAYVDSGDIWTLDLSSGESRQLTFDGHNSHPTWSPDGSQIAYHHDPSQGSNDYPRYDIYIIDVSSGETERFQSEACCAAWSPDGAEIAFFSMKDYWFEITSSDGVQGRLLCCDNFQGTAPYDAPLVPMVWTIDNTLYAEGSFLGVIQQIDIQGRRITQITGKGIPGFSSEYDSCLFDPSVSSTGLLLAATVMRSDGGFCSRPLGPSQIAIGSPDGSWRLLSEGTDPSWSPNADYLAFETPEGISLANAETGESQLILHGGMQPAFSPLALRATHTEPPGGLIAYVGHDGNIWVVDTRGENTTAVTSDALEFRGSDGRLQSKTEYLFPKWSPDGSHLAFIRSDLVIGADPVQDEGLWIFDLSNGVTSQLVGEHSIHGFDWMPDGSGLVYGPPVPDIWGLGTIPEAPIKGLWVIDIDGGEPFELVGPERGHPLAHPKWSAHGNRLSFEEVVMFEGRGNFAVKDFETGEYLAWDRTAGAYSWMPDEQWIVRDGVLYAVEETLGILRTDFRQNTSTSLSNSSFPQLPHEPIVSPDGQSVVFFSQSGGITQERSLWITNATGDSPPIMVSITSPASVDWSPDSGWLIASHGSHGSQKISIINPWSSETRTLAAGVSPTWQPAVFELKDSEELEGSNDDAGSTTDSQAPDDLLDVGGYCSDQGVEPPSLIDRIIGFVTGSEILALSAPDLFIEGQCTHFVAQGRPDVANWIGPYPRPAHIWDDRAIENGSEYGVFVDKNPRSGDIAVWETDCGGADTLSGHVAIVTGVDSDGETMRVDELNWSRPNPDVSILECMDFIHEPSNMSGEASSEELPGGEISDESAILSWFRSTWAWIRSLFE